MTLLDGATADDLHALINLLSAAPATAPPQEAAAPPQPPQPHHHQPALLARLFGGGRAQQPAAPPPQPCRRAIVMFSAAWCGPCTIVHKELVKALGFMAPGERPHVLCLDVEQCPDLASQLGIRSLPTLLYLGPDASKGPIVTQSVVSMAFLKDALRPQGRVEQFAGCDLKSTWLRL